MIVLEVEVGRLMMARLKHDGESLERLREISLMSRDVKLRYLAEGVIDGWYGNDFVCKAILKNLYYEVITKVVEIQSQEKHTL